LNLTAGEKDHEIQRFNQQQNNSKMILVTGSTGLLGRIIALELVKRGKKVRACKRAGSDLSEVKHSFKFYTSDANHYFDSIEWVDMDYEDHSSLYDSMTDITEIYHCAAKVSFDPDDREEILETGVNMTRTLLHAALYMKIKKFLFVSSASTFHVPGENLNPEMRDHPENINFPAHVISKCICEKMVLSAYTKGLNAIIINPGMIIGSGNWKGKKNMVTNFFAVSRFTFTGGTSVVDVRDVAAVAVDLMDKNLFGERFCIVSENILFKNLTQRIREKTGLSKPWVLPESFLRIISILRPILGILNAKTRFLTDENIEFVSEKKYFSGEKIKQLLDHQFYPANEAIQFHYGNYLTFKNQIRSR